VSTPNVYLNLFLVTFILLNPLSQKAVEAGKNDAMVSDFTNKGVPILSGLSHMIKGLNPG
jgi:hypothetical protein